MRWTGTWRERAPGSASRGLWSSVLPIALWAYLDPSSTIETWARFGHAFRYAQLVWLTLSVVALLAMRRKAWADPVTSPTRSMRLRCLTSAQ